MTTDHVPFVTVVVPVRDGAAHVRRCIEGLLGQDHPRERTTIVVVDNGSTDGTPDVVSSYPVTVLHETETLTSYAARNRGIAVATGDVIAFIDADCRPERGWLTAGLRALRDADLAGGNVVFEYSHRRSGAELFDSITNMQVERNVRERQVAKTANLFVRARVFDHVGPFPARMRSGGDVAWTTRATGAGHRLVYADDARVHHPARRLGELLRKQYRVGRGQPAAWRDAGRSRRGFLRLLARTLLIRGGPRAIQRELAGRGVAVTWSKALRASGAGVLAGAVTAVGALRACHELLGPTAPPAPRPEGGRS